MTEDSLTVGFKMKARVEVYRLTVMKKSRKRSAVGKGGAGTRV